MAKNKNFYADILISGAGTPGLCLSLLLSQLGLKIALIDPHKPQTLDDTPLNGRTVALMNSSLNVVKAAGLENPQDLGNPLEIMRIFDDSITGKEPQITEFEAFDIALDQFGYNIPNDRLRAALYELAENNKNIHLLCPQKLYDYKIEKNKVKVRLEDESIVTADLIIGADGRHSLVRTIAGIEIKKHEYGRSALTFLINHSKSHNNTSTEFHYPAGPLALVPLQGNQSSVVWVEKSERAEELCRIKKQDLEAVFQDKTHDILGACNIEGGVQSWPLCQIKAQSLTAPHVALIAEAAHVMSPITAQGLNLSLRDVAALAEVISDHARNGIALYDHALLKTYE
ncbi:MAG: FAD-dependent monooxygenase, partial [Alphaproteobacteria bacterium]